MLISRLTTIVAAASSGIAIFALSVLPAEHMHRSLSGPSVIHRHVADEVTEAHHESAGGTHTLRGHSEDGDAQTLKPVLGSAERQHLSLAPLVVAVLQLQIPESKMVVRVDLDDVPLAHGPPIRLFSLRGPPA